MIYIHKGEEPEFLGEFKRKNPDKNYDSKEFHTWIYPLREKLCEEQKGLCAYCCSRISVEKSHNEHIEPRNPLSVSVLWIIITLWLLAKIRILVAEKRKMIMMRNNLYLP